MKKCEQCGIEFEPKRASAKYCSPRCRVNASRGIETKEGVKVAPPVEEDIFRFRTPDKRSLSGYHEDAEGNVKIRTAKYWYDVPLAALPLVEEGWPEMPEIMNGREYFLWWKNNFAVEDGNMIIFNPLPTYKKLDYVAGGAQSRHWGA